MKVGILAGSVIDIGSLGPEGSIETIWGRTSSPIIDLVVGDKKIMMIARHGIPPSIPPHKINHKANIQALFDSGIESIISICSTGALRSDILVPGFAIPSDYIDLSSGSTFHDGDIFHTTPGLDQAIQSSLVEACRSSQYDPLEDSIYVQTRGPRLETKAEVRLLSGWGDVVGMNLGPEATLCSELGIRVGALLTVDNYANGIERTPLDFRDILGNARSRWGSVLEILANLPDRI